MDKNILVHFLRIMAGIFIIVVGMDESRSEATVFDLMTGLAFFSESASGWCFFFVRHVQPTANGECLSLGRSDDWGERSLRRSGRYSVSSHRAL